MNNSDIRELERVRAETSAYLHRLMTAVFLHYDERTDLDPVQAKHLELAREARARARRFNELRAALEEEHTPTPYEVEEWDGAAVIVALTKEAWVEVARVEHTSDEARAADAEFITRACNSHDALVALLRDVLGPEGVSDELRERIRHALNTVSVGEPPRSQKAGA